jgi:CRISPR/Cas system-associated exonuclease Cas4 (RecB family)
MKTLKHLSYSNISTYLRCPRAWWLHYVQGKRGPASNALSYGTAVHRILQERFSGGDPDIQKCVLEAAIKDRLPDFPVHEVSEEIRIILQDPAVSHILNGIVAQTPNIEVYVEYMVPDVPVPVIGFIDVVQNNGVPLDIKTSRYAWNEDRAARELQPLFYLYGLDHMGELVSTEFQYLIWVKDILMPQVYVVSNEYPNYKEEVPRILREAWPGMEALLQSKRPPKEKCGMRWCDCSNS